MEKNAAPPAVSTHPEHCSVGVLTRAFEVGQIRCEGGRGFVGGDTRATELVPRADESYLDLNPRRRMMV